MDGFATYTSQGESPLVDLVRHDLKSCGMSCTVQRIAPARGHGSVRRHGTINDQIAD